MTSTNQFVPTELPEDGRTSLDNVDSDILSEVVSQISNSIIEFWFDEDKRKWTPPSSSVLNLIKLNEAAEEVSYHDLASNLTEILAFSAGNTHRRYFGWVHGSGTIAGALSDFVASAMNSNCSGRNHLAVYIEEEVLSWSKKVLGFPEDSSGVLVSGTSVATLIAISVARYHCCGREILTKGLYQQRPLRIYICENAHMAIHKTVTTLGLGSENLVSVRLDPFTLSIDVNHLREVIEKDISNNLRPLAVVCTAGTVDAGLYDDFKAVHQVCKEYNLWMHIDAAFGAWLSLTSEPYRSLVNYFNTADSIACDFHKWLHVPYDCGMMLTKHRQSHLAAFSHRPDYLSPGSGLSSGDNWFCEYGIDLSRSFRALKVWSTIKKYGASKLGEAIARNCRQTQLFESLLRSSSFLDVYEKVISNICVFGLSLDLYDPIHVNAINRKVASILDNNSDPIISTTMYNNHFCLRLCITNHRTTTSDVYLSYQTIESIYLSVMSGNP